MGTTVGERVRIARERVGLSARALAQKADLSDGYVSLIERGERPSPSGEVLLKLATALGVSIDWLVTGRESGPIDDPDDPGPPRTKSGSMTSVGVKPTGS